MHNHPFPVPNFSDTTKWKEANGYQTTIGELQRREGDLIEKKVLDLMDKHDYGELPPAEVFKRLYLMIMTQKIYKIEENVSALLPTVISHPIFPDCDRPTQVLAGLVAWWNREAPSSATRSNQGAGTVRDLRDLGYKFRQEPGKANYVLHRKYSKDVGNARTDGTVQCRMICGYDKNVLDEKKYCKACNKANRHLFYSSGCAVCGSTNLKHLNADHRMPRMTSANLGIQPPALEDWHVETGEAHCLFRVLCDRCNCLKRAICHECQEGESIRTLPGADPDEYKKNWKDGAKSCNGCLHFNRALPLHSKRRHKKLRERQIERALKGMHATLASRWKTLYACGEVTAEDFWNAKVWREKIGQHAKSLIKTSILP